MKCSCALHEHCQPIRSCLLLCCWVLGEGLGCGVETLADGPWDLWSRVDDGTARAWLGALLVDLAAVLSCMTNERKRLGPTLDLRGDGAHALRGRGTDTAAVVPGGAVARWSGLCTVLSRDSELGIIVDLALEDWLLTTKQGGICLEGKACD